MPQAPVALPAAQSEQWALLRPGTALIVGFTARTGLAAARLLGAHGIRYRVSDVKSLAELRPLFADLDLAEADVHAGPQTPAQLDGISLVLLSPGVPRTIELVTAAIERGIPVLSDVDFIYPFVAHKPIVAITGTDGKTTTTELTAALLGTLGRVVVAGNIGIPVLGVYEDILACDHLVLEVSSFMLEGLQRFRPNISVVLNVAEDHVDRYRSLAEYASVKQNVFRHCTPRDVFLKNLDDPRLAPLAPANVTVRTMSGVDRTADYRFDGEAFHLPGATFRYSDCRLRGAHLALDVLAAAAIACELGVAPTTVAALARRFPGAPHRFQHLGSFRGVQVYDDSKATTVHAVDGALRSLDGPVVLIVGGRDKGLDFAPLRRHLSKIKHLACYGEAGPQIRRLLGASRSGYAFRFDEAVADAICRCAPGDALLLSPGCTSWDQFASYEERGAAFAAIVRATLG